MKFPRYWARGHCEFTDSRGKDCKISAWGWSDVSVADAERLGTERAKAGCERFLRGEPGSYGYADRPVREEIVQELTDGDGLTIAVITRNIRGCHVLNTTALAFIDVDLIVERRPDPVAEFSRSLFGAIFGRWFGKRPDEIAKEEREAQEKRAAEDAARLERAEQLLASHGLGARLYRTKAGERYLITNSKMDPKSDATAALMKEFDADPLYVKLCRAQECFRARLTPKPWRCGVQPLRFRYPWHGDKQRDQHRAWERIYLDKSCSYATCHFVKHIGSEETSDESLPLIELHDELTRAHSDLPLA